MKVLARNTSTNRNNYNRDSMIRRRKTRLLTAPDNRRNTEQMEKNNHWIFSTVRVLGPEVSRFPTDFDESSDTTYSPVVAFVFTRIPLSFVSRIPSKDSSVTLPYLSVPYRFNRHFLFALLCSPGFRRPDP